jgi:hypothetical protein
MFALLKIVLVVVHRVYISEHEYIAGLGSQDFDDIDHKAISKENSSTGTLLSFTRPQQSSTYRVETTRLGLCNESWKLSYLWGLTTVLPFDMYRP